MSSLQHILDNILCFFEGLSAFFAIIYFKNSNTKYWKYFALYLILIFVLDCLGRFGKFPVFFSKISFYNYLVIPFQFIFLYWLFAYKSLQKKVIFYIFSLLYLASFIPSEIYFNESKLIYSFNYTFGCLLLMILVILEYYKQINSDNILTFHQNKMFYINLGVSLFYIGTLPFYTFYTILYNDYSSIWKIYYIYFMISNIIMYFLFSISFIWGKQNS